MRERQREQITRRLRLKAEKERDAQVNRDKQMKVYLENDMV